MADQIIVITDTSLLVNFLAVDKVGLLIALPGKRFVVTDHVRTEVTGHYEEQLQRLTQALDAGELEEISVTDLVEVEIFANLAATGLGVGECSAIAVAANRGHAIAIDDKTALKRIGKLYPAMAVLTTQSIMLDLIQAGVISVAEADAITAAWQEDHRFTLPFVSFGDVLGE